MHLVAISAQWDDGGLRDLLPALADKADIVAFFSGPTELASAVRADSTVIFGSSMTLDADALSQLLIAGSDRILVSARAHLSLPSYHRYGAATAEALKVVGEGVRVHQLFDGSLPDELSDEDEAALAPIRSTLSRAMVEPVDFLRHSGDAQVLHVGFRGALRDTDLTVYPLHGIGAAAASVACTSSGIGPTAVDAVLAVSKAYTAAPVLLPSALSEVRDAATLAGIRAAEPLAESSDKYDGESLEAGIGHLDLVALRYACAASSVSGVALTRLGALASGQPVRVCVAYENDSGSTLSFPASAASLESYRAVTKTVSGWQNAEEPPTTYDQVPDGLRALVDVVEEFVEAPVDLLSYREGHTITRRNPWTEY